MPLHAKGPSQSNTDSWHQLWHASGSCGQDHSGCGSRLSIRGVLLVRAIHEAAIALCKERCVPAWVLSGLVKAQGIPWQVGPQGPLCSSEMFLTITCVSRRGAACNAPVPTAWGPAPNNVKVTQSRWQTPPGCALHPMQQLLVHWERLKLVFRHALCFAMRVPAR